LLDHETSATSWLRIQNISSHNDLIDGAGA
jgi:hypothetical protein